MISRKREYSSFTHNAINNATSPLLPTFSSSDRHRKINVVTTTGFVLPSPGGPPGGDGWNPLEVPSSGGRGTSTWEPVISNLKLIQSLFPSETFVELGTTSDIQRGIKQLVKEALIALEWDVRYDEALFESLKFKKFTSDDYKSNDARLSDKGLEKLLNEKLAPLRAKAGDLTDLLQELQGVTNLERVVELLTEGQKAFMEKEFKPNGGKEIKMSTSYKRMEPICNDAILKDVRLGRAVAFSEDALAASGFLREIHINNIAWAEKTNKVEGRTCMNASSSTKNTCCLNDLVDKAAHDAHYPMGDLPSARTICEMICEMREAYPGEELSGATVDVASAYKQTPVLPEMAKLLGVRVKATNDNGKRVNLIVLYLVGVFGFTRAGHVYCTCASAINEMHNMGVRPRESLTYIDDGMIVAPTNKIRESVERYCGHIVALFGPTAVQEEKTKIWCSKLEAIGWQFNLETWKVLPKKLGVQKLIVHLFHRVKVGEGYVLGKDFERLMGSLNWYSEALPMGKSFLSSLYACQNRRLPSQRVKLTPDAISDLNWWRAIALMIYYSPDTVGGDISMMRLCPKHDLFLRTDACTSIGGGAILSMVKGGDPISMGGDAIRWTRLEMELFVEHKVSINVLEYFVTVYYIMMWGNFLRGKVIFTEVDNTSAVSWLSRMRSTHTPHADALTRVFSLFCLRENIVIISAHLPGIKNDVADDLSRYLSYASQDADEVLPGTELSALIRPQICRQLLTLCVTRPDEMRSRSIATLLMMLE